MNKKVKIISDSTCDLTKEIIDKYDISILPLHVLLGDEEYLDGVNISQSEIFKWADANETTPKTSAPSIEDAVELFKPFIDDGRDIVCFSISSSMSTSFNCMKLAAEELGAENRITVIDSGNLSTGIGLLVVRAAEMAKEGAYPEEIEEEMEILKPKVRASFVVDTLVYLHRGGRCSGLAAFLGSTLKMHPKIVVENGKMHSEKKYRGNIDRAVRDYVNDMKETMKGAIPDRVFITHSSIGENVVEQVKKILLEEGVFKEIIETNAGGVISSHCGPGTLGVLYIMK